MKSNPKDQIRPAPARCAAAGLRLVTVIAALLVSACAGQAADTGTERSYLLVPPVDVIRLLAPPPRAAAQVHDRDMLRAVQSARTPEQIAMAESHAALDVFGFSAVLGPDFIRERLPTTARFFAKANRDIGPYVTAGKDCWRRQRPFVEDPGIEPTPKALASTRTRQQPPGETQQTVLPPAPFCVATDADSRFIYSYPSGHATFGAVNAILLAQMVPERRDELFALGWEYGEARIIAGVHYPSDVEAARILSTTLVALMTQDARFRDDMRAATTELRAVLGLSH